MNASKSNQQATHNRQKAIYCVSAAANETSKLRRFHRVCRTDPEIARWLGEIDARYAKIVNRMFELIERGELIEGR